MGLGSALVDRGQVFVHAPTGRKINGATEMEWQPGPIFKCRMEPEAGPEAADAAGGRPNEVSETPGLMTAAKDLSGVPLRITSEQRIRVTSQQLGVADYDVMGNPSPIRKKRKVIGFNVALQRVIDYPRAPVVVGP
jgi:hypothetical protein